MNELSNRCATEETNIFSPGSEDLYSVRTQQSWRVFSLGLSSPSLQFSLKVNKTSLSGATPHHFYSTPDAICGNGETELSVVINDGDTFNYKTSKKGKYSNNMDCFVYYELGESCEEMTLSCNKINIKNNKACTNGDTLLITNDEGEKT